MKLLKNSVYRVEGANIEFIIISPLGHHRSFFLDTYYINLIYYELFAIL